MISERRKLSISSVAVIGIIVILIVFVSIAAALYKSGENTTTVTSTRTVTNFGETSTQTVYLQNTSGSASLGIDTVLIYNETHASIVTVQGDQNSSTAFGQQSVPILGSGFVIQFNGADYIVTNYHVAGATSNLTVTFSDGDGFAASLVGSDPYSDLAILSISGASSSEFHPLVLTPSSTLQVGAPVVAIGNPFGLSGSMTFGIVSQLGRTIQDPTAGNFSIANVIQFSAPINPGNSGGPLLDSNGDVIGVTTAVVGGSQGVGFAIPSDTIIKELSSLISSGSYTQHSYLGISGADMNYEIAKAIGTSVTYGVLVESTAQGGPAASGGLKAGSKVVVIDDQQYLIGGDIIVSINGTKIVNNDALAAYLQEYTIPGQTAVIGVIRSGTLTTMQVTLGTRPPP